MGKLATWTVRSVATANGPARLELHSKNKEELAGQISVAPTRAAGRRPVALRYKLDEITAGVRRAEGKGPYWWIGTSEGEGDATPLTRFLLDRGFQRNQRVVIHLDGNVFTLFQ